MSLEMIVLLPIAVTVFAIAVGLLIGRKHKARCRYSLIWESATEAKPRDVIIAVAVIAVAIGLRMASFAVADAAQRDMVREQFALSEDIDLVEFEFRQGHKTYKSQQTTAIYRFTDEQLREYIAALDDPERWRPHRLDHAGRSMGGVYTPEARRWQEFPRTLYAADIQGRTFLDLPWIYSLWWEQDWESLKNGRIMCFLYERVDPRTVPGMVPDDPYKVSACSEVAKSNHKMAYVLGILDYDRKTLFVRVY